MRSERLRGKGVLGERWALENPRTGENTGPQPRARLGL